MAPGMFGATNVGKGTWEKLGENNCINPEKWCINYFSMYLYLYKKAPGDIHRLHWSNCAWKWGKYLQISHWLQCAVSKLVQKIGPWRVSGVAFFGLSGSVDPIFFGFWGDSEGSFPKHLGHKGGASLFLSVPRKASSLFWYPESSLLALTSHILYPYFAVWTTRIIKKSITGCQSLLFRL